MRAVWKGFLKLASVSCAVKLAGATSESERIHFRTLNRKTRNPVRAQYVDEETGKAVEREDQVRGFQLENEDYLVLEPEELKQIKVPSEHTIEISEFTDLTAIPSYYREKPYYLYPSDKVGVEAFAVMREAMARKKTGGIGYITLYQKERPVVIEPWGDGLLMTTLRYNNWVVDAKDLFSGIGKTKVDPEMVEIASLIIEKKQGKFDPSKFEDTYETALRDLIEAKRAGKKLPKPQPAPKENVVKLADVLRKSLEKEGVKAPAKETQRRQSAEPARKRA